MKLMPICRSVFAVVAVCVLALGELLWTIGAACFKIVFHAVADAHHDPFRIEKPTKLAVDPESGEMVVVTKLDGAWYND